MMSSKTNKIIKTSLRISSRKYQKSLESQKISDPIFDYVDMLYYKLHNASPLKKLDHNT